MNIPHIITLSVNILKAFVITSPLTTLLMTTSTRVIDHFNRWTLIFASHLFRVSLAGMYITRPSLKIGRYKMIKHKLDKGNDVNPKRYNQMHLKLNSDKDVLFLVIGEQNAVCLVGCKIELFVQKQFLKKQYIHITFCLCDTNGIEYFLGGCASWFSKGRLLWKTVYRFLHKVQKCLCLCQAGHVI